MESRTGMSTKEQIEQLMTRVDEMNEKLYEFETNKKNNLIFYGIPGETRETPPVLMTKVGGLENKDISTTIHLQMPKRYLTTNASSNT